MGQRLEVNFLQFGQRLRKFFLIMRASDLITKKLCTDPFGLAGNFAQVMDAHAALAHMAKELQREIQQLDR